MGMYIEERNVVYIGFSTICRFRHSLGFFEHIPHEQGEDHYIYIDVYMKSCL